ncbi:MAG: protein kinase [Planctomycetota bacterium]
MARALFEVLLEDGAVPADEAEAALRGPLRTLGCSACDARFELARELTLALLEGGAECPVCEQGGVVAQAGDDGDPPEEEDEETKHGKPAPTSRARTVGPYRLRRLLGAGGMGSVHLAEGPGGEQVALKLLGGAFEDAARRERFEREGAFLRDSVHPNIVRVLGSGVDDATGRPYLALEVVPGRDLETAIEEAGALAIDEVIAILDQVAAALGFLHTKGILHRDLTAANVLATPFGEIKLSDFGLALDLSDSVRLTLTGKVVGTPVAIDPAVLRGEEWCPASDLYALGIMAFRLLTAEEPFPGKTPAEVFEGQLNLVPPRVDELRPDVPPFLADLVVELLDKEAEARPTALEVRERLSDHLPHAATLIRLGRRLEGGGQDDDTSTIAPQSSGSGVSGSQTSSEGFAPGETLHNFEIEAEIGRGGMGVVYRAKHLKLKRRVALKVLLRGSLAKKEERRRFLREAEAAGVLNHPNVVSILDAGEVDGRTFICLDYVKGQSLVQRIREGSAREDLLRLFIQICEGVHHAHSRGVIHRDLKPDNILVDERGAARILDFGIAKRLDEQDSGDTTGGALTTEGDILGTLRYMPPEQAAGKVEDIDVRSDVYALGTILYEMLCAQTPFRGTMAEVLHQIHFADPTPPSKRQRDVPWELDAICLKALEKDRDHRYQSALALKQDVQRFLEGLPIEARRATLAYRARKWASRNKGRAAAILAVIVVVTGLAAGWAGTVVAAERRYRSDMLQRIGKGIDLYEHGKFREARESFVAAYEQIHRGELLLLPPELATRIPAADGRVGGREQEWVTDDRLSRWARWALERAERGEVERFLNEARTAFSTGRLAEASQSLQVAARLDPREERVTGLIAEVSSALVARGRQHLDRAPADDPARRREALEAARRNFEQAQRLDRNSREAVGALLEVASELGKLAQAEREAAVHERNHAECGRLVRQGKSALNEERLEDARRAFEQALAFDGASPEARDGLLEVQRRLSARLRAEERRAEEQRAADERRERQEKVTALLGKALRALDGGDLEAARIAYIQALAFDGSNGDAQKGLVEVYRREEERKRGQDRRRDRARLEGFLREAAQGLEAGRRAFRESKDPAEVREAYFAAMESVRSGLLLEPDHRPARQLLHRIAAELAEILIDQGYPELAGFVRRIGGVPDDVGAELPQDPYLVVIEASVVNLRSAFGAIVLFVPTDAFDALREKVRELTGERYRVRIEVRSHVVKKGLNSEVDLEGLWVSLEDREKKTKRTIGEVRFEGGPYHRIVQIDSRGRRIVRAFDQSRGFDARPYVRRVFKMVVDAIKPEGNGSGEK